MLGEETEAMAMVEWKNGCGYGRPVNNIRKDVAWSCR